MIENFPFLLNYDFFSEKELAQLSAFELAFLFILFPEKISKVDLSKGYNALEIAFLVQHLPSTVTSVNLANTAIEDVAIQAISNCEFLERLDLSEVRRWNPVIPVDRPDVWFDCMKRIKNLKYLKYYPGKNFFDHFHLPTHYLKALVTQSPELETLLIPGFSGKRWNHFAEIIGRSNFKLQTLDLSYGMICREGIVALSNNGNLRNSLTHLILNESNPLKKEDFMFLIEQFPHLKTFHFANVRCVDSESIKKLSELQSLESLKMTIPNDRSSSLDENDINLSFGFFRHLGGVKAPGIKKSTTGQY